MSIYPSKLSALLPAQSQILGGLFSAYCHWPIGLHEKASMTYCSVGFRSIELLCLVPTPPLFRPFCFFHNARESGREQSFMHHEYPPLPLAPPYSHPPTHQLAISLGNFMVEVFDNVSVLERASAEKYKSIMTTNNSPLPLLSPYPSYPP